MILILIMFYWMKNHTKIVRKTPYSEKPSHIIFDKVDVEYLVLFHPDKKYREF